jgi:serine/threonine protein kinase
LNTNIEKAVLAAYKTIHGRSALHNDIRPENVLVLEADESVRIIDFEFASILPEPDMHLLDEEDAQVMAMLQNLKNPIALLPNGKH